MTAEPEGQRAAAAGRGRFRTSRADREDVIDVLKAAFVQGLLAKDEFDARVDQTFASRTYAELVTVTADLPTGLIADQPAREPARAQGRPSTSHAAQAYIFLAIAVAVMALGVLAPAGPALFLLTPVCLAALGIAGAHVVASCRASD